MEPFDSAEQDVESFLGRTGVSPEGYLRIWWLVIHEHPALTGVLTSEPRLSGPPSCHVANVCSSALSHTSDEFQSGSTGTWMGTELVILALCCPGVRHPRGAVLYAQQLLRTKVGRGEGSWQNTKKH